MLKKVVYSMMGVVITMGWLAGFAYPVQQTRPEDPVVEKPRDTKDQQKSTAAAADAGSKTGQAAAQRNENVWVSKLDNEALRAEGSRLGSDITIVSDPDTSTKILRRDRFSYVSPGQARGNIGLNVFRKQGIQNVNAAVSRQWKWVKPRSFSLQFRAEAFSLMNRNCLAPLKAATDFTNSYAYGIRVSRRTK